MVRHRMGVPLGLCKKCWVKPPNEQVREIKSQKVRERYQRNLEHNREVSRKRHLIGTYGISLVQQRLMFHEQCEACAICGAKESGARGWTIDHDHNTGLVRGVLCNACNVALGFYEKATANGMLSRFDRYLKRSAA